ncbi:transcriptional regulator [Bradyrhizobium sp. CCBAU 051011]|uniref:ArsR/SmtB family transcription factor n=1 Tax=Bradyrhizobium sp. CCBAU 051011 TaxID=858422 RepID=UPI0013744965|nr:metalloregulator ArsR/SmtB family transcription factor [Bradyrhizobium sp. CCBAU 051011]QHO75710.1 transcriptional regulator [Bradyrhizobium sp. CCBAU 051011]
MPSKIFSPQGIEKAAVEVAGVLRALANERRLVILCKLVERGEANVNSLAETVGLSQSALSQHLAKMREEGLVTYRRESQTLWYRIADPRIEDLLATLHTLYCKPLNPR